MFNIITETIVYACYNDNKNNYTKTTAMQHLQ